MHIFFVCFFNPSRSLLSKVYEQLKRDIFSTKQGTQEPCLKRKKGLLSTVEHPLPRKHWAKKGATQSKCLYSVTFMIQVPTPWIPVQNCLQNTSTLRNLQIVVHRKYHKNKW